MNTQNPCNEIQIDGGLNMFLEYGLSPHKEYVSKLVYDKLEEVSSSSGKLKNFFSIINKVEKANIAVCGGAVRDWHLDKEPKDIDIVIDCPNNIIEMLCCNFPHKRSQFNGYMFDVGGVKIDIWRLEDSWIFTKNSTITKTWKNLLESFPFNIDSILVFGDGRCLACGFFEGLSHREIELVNPINKNPETNIVQRAIRFRNKYGFKIGPKLQAEIDNHSKNNKIDYKNIGKIGKAECSSN